MTVLSPRNMGDSNLETCRRRSAAQHTSPVLAFAYIRVPCEVGSR
jgi:hypothetical protein